MFFNQTAGHMQNFRQIQAKSKCDLKFDIGWLCSRPSNCVLNITIKFNYRQNSCTCLIIPDCRLILASGGTLSKQLSG